MTTSIWYQDELSDQFPGCQTLKDIIERIEERFAGRGEVICEIRVNGVLLDDNDEVKMAASPCHQIRDLAIRSKSPAALIIDAMRSAHEFLSDLENSCLKTAELFRGSELLAAQKSFHECLQGCQWLVDTLMHARGAASGISQPIAQPERWFEAEKILTRVIREISDAYTRKDYVLVADLLEYELTGSIAVWNAALSGERSLREAAVVQPSGE